MSASSPKPVPPPLPKSDGLSDELPPDNSSASASAGGGDATELIAPPPGSLLPHGGLSESSQESSQTRTTDQPLDLSGDFDSRFGKDEFDGQAMPGTGTADDDSAMGGPLSPEHFDAIEDASERRRKIDKAQGMAGFNAWSCVIIGGMSLLIGLLTMDPLTIVMAVGLCLIGANEFKGRTQLRALEVAGLHRLMWNQVIFLVMIIAYSLFQIATAATGPGRYDEYLNDPELMRMLGPIGDLHKTLTLAVYISVIVVSIVFQGGTALYYRRKRAILETYLSETPQWVVKLQKR